MADSATISWQALEAEWRDRNTYHYKRTDLVSLLRDADKQVNAFKQRFPERAAAIEAAAAGPAAPLVANGCGEDSTDRANSSEKRRRQETAMTPREGEDEGKREEMDKEPPRTRQTDADAQEEVSKLLSLGNEPAFEHLYKHLVKIQAPMVRFSRPPFRKLCRLWGTDVSYTHMILAEGCANSANARHADVGVYTGEDRLIVQLAAKSGPTAAQAARLLLPYCDAFDLNCGCPQRWAMREGLGSALLEKPELVADMVKCIRNAVEGFPLDTASGEAASPNNSGMAAAACVVKMRVNDDIRRSVEFARQVAAAGAAWVTVHGRTPLDSPTARLRCEAVRLIREELARSGVPVVVNGGVTNPSSAALAAVASGTGGVMCANGLLDNPAAFYLPEDGRAVVGHLTFAPLTHRRQEFSDGGVGWETAAPPLTAPEQMEHGLAHAPQLLLRQQRGLLALARPSFAASDDAFRPLWGLPITPLEVLSDFLRLSVRMSSPFVTTVQQAVRLGRAYLAPTERAQLSYVKSNIGALSFFDELGLYSDRGNFTL